MIGTQPCAFRAIHLSTREVGREATRKVGREAMRRGVQDGPPFVLPIHLREDVVRLSEGIARFADLDRLEDARVR